MLDPSKEVHIVPDLPEWCAKIVRRLNAGRALNLRYTNIMKQRYNVTDSQIAGFVVLYMQALEAAKEAMFIHTAVVNPNEPEVTDVSE